MFLLISWAFTSSTKLHMYRKGGAASWARMPRSCQVTQPPTSLWHILPNSILSPTVKLRWKWTLKLGWIAVLRVVSNHIMPNLPETSSFRLAKPLHCCKLSPPGIVQWHYRAWPLQGTIGKLRRHFSHKDWQRLWANRVQRTKIVEAAWAGASHVIPAWNELVWKLNLGIIIGRARQNPKSTHTTGLFSNRPLVFSRCSLSPSWSNAPSCSIAAVWLCLAARRYQANASRQFKSLSFTWIWDGDDDGQNPSKSCISWDG